MPPGGPSDLHPAAGGEGGEACTPKRVSSPLPCQPSQVGRGLRRPRLGSMPPTSARLGSPLAKNDSDSTPSPAPTCPPPGRAPPAPGPPPRAPAAADAARCDRSHGSTSFRRSKSETRRRAIARTQPPGGWGPAPRAFPALRAPPRPSPPAPAPPSSPPASPRRPLSVLLRPGLPSPERRLLQAGWARRAGGEGDCGAATRPTRPRTFHVRPSGGLQTSGRICCEGPWRRR